MSRAALPLALLAAVGWLGCAHQSGEPVASEPTFDEQLAAVLAGESDVIEVRTALVNDAALARIPDQVVLRQLVLENTTITDAEAVRLTRFSELFHLRLGGALLTDRSLEAFAKLPALRFLNLPDARFTDQGLAALAEGSQLEQLRFHSPHVSDAGMEHIAEMGSLRFLHLIRLPITDAGLAPLSALAQLESLYVDGCDLSQGALQRLVEECPGLHLHIDEGHLPGQEH